jgi:hypothetical protein
MAAKTSFSLWLAYASRRKSGAKPNPGLYETVDAIFDFGLSVRLCVEDKICLIRA